MYNVGLFAFKFHFFNYFLHFKLIHLCSPLTEPLLIVSVPCNIGDYEILYLLSK